MDLIYWVISKDCNQSCPHCYNDSRPGAPGLSERQASAVVANLPDPDAVPVGSVYLSGGEPLQWPGLLFHTLGELHRKYGDRNTLGVQTNGDLLDGPTLDRMLATGVNHVTISSQDRYHQSQSRRNRPALEALLAPRGFTIVPFDGSPPESDVPRPPKFRAASIWGATDDLWIGPLWPRGRAEANGLSRCTADDDFCGQPTSGARRFLDYRGAGNASAVSIQLSDVYPSCTLTCRPIGDAAREPLTDILDRLAGHPVFEALNRGHPEAMGESMGYSEAHGRARSEALGSHCLWCDEFFETIAPDLLPARSRTGFGTANLTIRGKRADGLPAKRIRAEAAVEVAALEAAAPTG